MGTDVYFYKNLRFKSENGCDDCNDDCDKCVLIFAYSCYPFHNFPNKKGRYDAELVGSFRAGSYANYWEWRKVLCRCVNGIEIEELSQDDPLKPFYFLLNFTDNEGSISGVALKKLQKDFLAHPALDLGDGWLNEKYEFWRKFVLESDCVAFS